MKKSELRRLVARYQEVQIRLKKSQNNKLKKESEEIEHRYYHETGRNLELDLKENTVLNVNLEKRIK